MAQTTMNIHDIPRPLWEQFPGEVGEFPYKFKGGFSVKVFTLGDVTITIFTDGIRKRDYNNERG